jgi:8-oxo-dGTP diphosphatase
MSNSPSTTHQSLTTISIAVVEHNDQFLIGVRPEGVPLAGYWEFPGGKLQPGETPAEAARRECIEETGLDVVIGSAYPEVVHQYDHAKLRLHFLAARPVDASVEPRAPFRWVRRDELARYTFPPANEALVRYLSTRETAS